MSTLNIISAAIKPIASALVAHWRVWSWLQNKFDLVMGNANLREPRSLGEMWEGILTGDYKNGDIVRIHGWFLSDWFPKIPGRYWYAQINGLNQIYPEHDIKNRLFGMDYFLQSARGFDGLLDDSYFFDPICVEQGVVRLAPSDTKDFCTILGMVTAEDWHAELGIPVRVSRQVYREYFRRRGKSAAVEVDLEARLRFLAPKNSLKGFIEAIGVRLGSPVKELLGVAVGIPYCCLEVTSLLDMKMRRHSTHPFLYVTSLGFAPTYRAFDMFRVFYNATSAEEDELRRVADWFEYQRTRAHEITSFSKADQRWHTQCHEGYLLNDFDGQVRRLKAIVPITLNPFDQQEREQMLKYFKKGNLDLE